MLAKLFKYDFRAISRINLPATLLAAAMTVLGTAALKVIINIISVGESSFTRSAITAGLVIVVISAALGIIAYAVICAISVYGRFYKNFFTDEGYLTFTLPVRPHTLVLSKMFAAAAWELIALIVTVLLVGAMVAVGGAPQGQFINIGLVKDLFNIICEVLSISPGTAAIFIIAVIAQWISKEFAIFLAISIGSTVARKQKILTSVAFYFVINTCISIASTVLVVIAGMLFGEGILSLDYFDTASFMSTFSAATAVFYAAVAALEFFFINHIVKNKLNLS